MNTAGRRVSRFSMKQFTIRYPGFSIVELLVSIGLVGVLITILLPALGGAMQLARRTGSLANLRSLGQLVHHYNDANAEAYPWGHAGMNSCGVQVHFFPIWQMATQWPLIMHGVIGLEHVEAMTLAPGANRDANGCAEPPSYAYSQAFLADPATWNGSGVANESQLRSVGVYEVVFPSGKALMWDWELPYLNRPPRSLGPDLDEPTPMLFADSHGSGRTPSRANAAIENPFSDADAPTARLHNTPHGVRGRDF